MKSYGRRVAVAIDQLFNALFGGDEDETISSRAAKARMKGKRWGCLLCRFLDWLAPNHCANSIEPDEGEKVSERSNAGTNRPPRPPIVR